MTVDYNFCDNLLNFYMFEVYIEQSKGQLTLTSVTVDYKFYMSDVYIEEPQEQLPTTFMNLTFRCLKCILNNPKDS